MEDGGAASAHDLLGVDGDTLTDMLAGFSFVYHGDGVIGIADEAFPFGIGGEFLAGQPVGSGTFTLGLEVGGGADVGPLHVVAVAQQIEGGDMCCGDRFVGVKELRSVLKGLGVFFVYKQAACTSNNGSVGCRCRKAGRRDDRRPVRSVAGCPGTRCRRRR